MAETSVVVRLLSGAVVQADFSGCTSVAELHLRVAEALDVRRVELLFADGRLAEGRALLPSDGPAVQLTAVVLEDWLCVLCRLRPLSKKEQRQGEDVAMQCVDSRSIEVFGQGVFEFDAVLPAEGTQAEVYAACGDILHSALQPGGSGCVLAYGQSGTGKTHTMMSGTECDSQSKDSCFDGIIPHTCKDLFEKSPGVVVGMTMLMLLHGQVFDLLSPSDMRASKIQIRSSSLSPFPELRNATEQCCRDADELHICLARAQRKRWLYLTHMSSLPSASSLVILTSGGGRLVMCDLASAQTNHVDQNMFASLGAVFRAINSRSAHVPWRNSPLTHLLKGVVGPGSRTALILTCSPAGCCTANSLSTFAFGKDAKM